MDKDQLKISILQLAHNNDDDPDKVIERAEKYEKFLKEDNN